MKKYLDIDSWNRKEHFHFFKGFDDPFFGLTVDVDFTNVYNKTKREKGSFFLDSLYTIMCAVNRSEPFRYRIEDDKVVCYDKIHISSTIGREDGTFGFSLFEYDINKDIFIENARQAIEKVKSSSGLMLSEEMNRLDVIHFSPVPWFRFTDMKHATSFGRVGSPPKVSTGQLYQDGQCLKLPVSITVNHALMDGLHVAQFLDILNDCIIAN